MLATGYKSSSQDHNNKDGEGTKTRRTGTPVVPQEPETANWQVDEETADIANLYTTYAEPTRPVGASRDT